MLVRTDVSPAGRLVKTLDVPVSRAPMLLAFLAGFTVPLKAARFDVAGLSLYLTYVIAAVVAVRYWRQVIGFAMTWFLIPLVVLATFAASGVVRGVGPVQPIITIGKLSVAFVVAAVFGVLLLRSSLWVYRGLFGGMAFTVAFMVYQMVSAMFFGFGLPFTTSERFQIGLGLSRRFGLTRVTGFTEEPSFVATMLVASTLLLVSYAVRTHRPRLQIASAVLGALGLGLSTSNNLFATTLIIAAFWPLVRRRRVAILFSVYYMAALLVTPFVLFRDLTYFARFSAYDIFLRSSPTDQLIGHGVGAYPEFFDEHQIMFDGFPIDSLASLWGGVLFEGGLVLVGLAIYWVAKILRRADWRDALALLALLLMLSNFNSPWWPIVSLALAQCFISRPKDTSWTKNSTSPATSTDSNAVPDGLSPWRSSARWAGSRSA